MSIAADEVEQIRVYARGLRRRAVAALAEIDRALVEHGRTGDPLVDVLLDVRNTLRGP